MLLKQRVTKRENYWCRLNSVDVFVLWGATQKYKLCYLFICTAVQAKEETESLPTEGIPDLVYSPLVEIRGR